MPPNLPAERRVRSGAEAYGLPMFETGDRIRFPDPKQHQTICEGTFVERGGVPIEVPSRVGGVPSRLVDSAVVRRPDGTTALVIYAWIRPG